MKELEKQLHILNDLIIEMKTKLMMLEKENEFLRELLRNSTKSSSSDNL